ncbi:MAG: SPASM domain-containing protein, partial [Spirochaetota bacterium]
CKLFDLWYDDGFPYVSIRLFEDILIYLVDGALVSCCWMNECTSYIVVEHNGDCYPCDFFVYPEWHIGNITRDSLPSILKNSKRQLFSKMKSDVPVSCNECEWYDFCHGDCTRFRLDRNGKFTNTSEYCQAWSMLLEHIKPRKDELKKRAVNLRESVISGNFDQVGRNDDCPCGSGKKFKKCCGRGTLVI